MNRYFTRNAVRFEKMNELTEDIFKLSGMRSINIFINVDFLFQKLKNSHINEVFQCVGTDAGRKLASCLINLFAHYKQWAIRRNVRVKVFGFWTSEKVGFDNSIFIPDYRDYYAERCSFVLSDYFYINKAIYEGMPLVSTICDHIDNVYMLDSHFVEPSVIPYIISKHVNRADWNLIISRDPYDLQYVNVDRFSVICPIKTKTEEDKRKLLDYNTEDLSFMITRSNLWRSIRSMSNFKSDLKDNNYFIPTLYPLCLAAVGEKHRSIQPVSQFSWPKIIKTLNSIHDECDAGFSEDTVRSEFLKKFKKTNTSIEKLNNNVRAISIFTNYNNTATTSIELIKSQIVDKPDYENLYELNNNPAYFASYPLNIQFLAMDIRKAEVDSSIYK